MGLGKESHRGTVPFSSHDIRTYDSLKENKIIAFAGKWVQLENIMLSEVSQSQKTKGQMFSLVSGC